VRLLPAGVPEVQFVAVSLGLQFLGAAREHVPDRGLDDVLRLAEEGRAYAGHLIREPEAALDGKDDEEPRLRAPAVHVEDAGPGVVRMALLPGVDTRVGDGLGAGEEEAAQVAAEPGLNFPQLDERFVAERLPNES
jgi:hypothetical protein